MFSMLCFLSMRFMMPAMTLFGPISYDCSSPLSSMVFKDVSHCTGLVTCTQLHPSSTPLHRSDGDRHTTSTDFTETKADTVYTTTKRKQPCKPVLRYGQRSTYS